MSVEDIYKPDKSWLIKIIKSDSEHPLYDFKAQLKIHQANKDSEKELRAELIRDIIALANKALIEQRNSFLIIGASRGKIVEMPESFDDNTFQNFINSHIKPKVDFLYSESEINGKKIGIFSIVPRGEIIFTFSKDYKTSTQNLLLKKGETYIREGSKKTKISDTTEIIELQRLLDGIILRKQKDVSLSQTKTSEFWKEYKKFISIWFDNLDFLGISNLKDEKPTPLSEIFIALKFGIDKNISENAEIIARSIKLITDYYGNIKEEDLEDDITLLESLLNRIFSEVYSLENSSQTIEFYYKIIKNLRKIILIGGPGFGKTTLLKFIALESVKNNSLRDDEAHYPYFVALQNFERFIIKKKSEGESYSLIEFIATDLHSKEFTKNYSFEEVQFILEERISKENNIFLFDGLDEISDSKNRIEIQKNIRIFSSNYQKNMIIISSRNIESLAYLKSTDFFPIYLKELQLYEIRKFVHSWYAIRETDVNKAKSISNQLIKEINTNNYIRTLSQNPLILTILTLVHRIEGRVPQDRTTLYKKIVSTFLETWDSSKGLQSKIPLDLLKKSLYLIAFETKRNFVEGRGASLKLDKCKKMLISYLNSEEKYPSLKSIEVTDEILNDLKNRSGVIIVEDDSLLFWHFSFIDFLSAQYLFTNYYDSTKQLWGKIRELLTNPNWFSVLFLLFGLFRDLPSKILKDIIDKILKSKRIRSNLIPVFLVDVFIENTEIQEFYSNKLMNYIRKSLLKKQEISDILIALRLLEKIKDFLTQNFVNIIFEIIFKHFIALSEPRFYIDGSFLQNPTIHFLDVLFSVNPDFVFKGLEFCAERQSIDINFFISLKEMEREKLNFIISAIEYRELNYDFIKIYHSFKEHEIESSSEIQIVEIPGECKELIELYYNKYAKTGDVVSYLYLNHICKIHGIENEFDFILSDKPLAVLGTKKQKESDSIKKKELKINDLFKPQFWVSFQIDKKISKIIKKFEYKFEQTFFVNLNTPTDRFYKFEKNYKLEAFKSINIKLDENLFPDFHIDDDNTFRMRIQMRNSQWFISRKIDFFNSEEKDRFFEKMQELEQVVKPFEIVIIFNEENNLSNISQRYYEEKKFDDAIKYADSALVLDPFLYKALVIKAEILGIKYCFEESLVLCDTIRKNYPNSEWVFHRIALNLSLMKKYKKVKQICQEALSLEIQNDSLLLLYADALSNLKEYALALKFFEMISENLLDNSKYNMLRGFHEYKIGNFEGSKLYLDRAVNKIEKFSYVYEITTFMIYNKDIKNAKFWLERIKKIPRDKNIILKFQIEIGILEKKYKQCLELIDEKLKKDSEKIPMWNFKGIIYQDIGKFDKAKSCYQQIIELSPNDGLGYYNLSCILALEGNLKDSVKFLQKAIKLDDNLKEQAIEEKDFDSIKRKKAFKNIISN